MTSSEEDGDDDDDDDETNMMTTSSANDARVVVSTYVCTERRTTVKLEIEKCLLHVVSHGSYLLPRS